MHSAATITLNDDGTITETRTIPAIITLAEAAHMLDVPSRIEVLNLIAERRLNGVEHLNHTMVRSHDVVLLRADLMAERRAAFEELREIEDAADL